MMKKMKKVFSYISNNLLHTLSINYDYNYSVGTTEHKGKKTRAVKLKEQKKSIIYNISQLGLSAVLLCQITSSSSIKNEKAVEKEWRWIQIGIIIIKNTYMAKHVHSHIIDIIFIITITIPTTASLALVWMVYQDCREKKKKKAKKKSC